MPSQYARLADADLADEPNIANDQSGLENVSLSSPSKSTQAPAHHNDHHHKKSKQLGVGGGVENSSSSCSDRISIQVPDSASCFSKPPSTAIMTNSVTVEKSNHIRDIDRTASNKHKRQRFIKFLGSPECPPHQDYHPSNPQVQENSKAPSPLLSQQPLLEVDAFDANDEDPFTLESYEGLIRLHAERGKDFIIARVTTVDPHDENKFYYSYYAAHHINKVIFRTQPEEGLLHRMRSKNPLNNMTIVGDIHYYIISASSVDLSCTSSPTYATANPTSRISIDSFISILSGRSTSSTSSSPSNLPADSNESITSYRRINFDDRMPLLKRPTSANLGAGINDQTTSSPHSPRSPGKISSPTVNSSTQSLQIPTVSQLLQFASSMSMTLTQQQQQQQQQIHQHQPHRHKRILRLIMKKDALDVSSSIKSNNKVGRQGSIVMKRRNSVDSALSQKPPLLFSDLATTSTNRHNGRIRHQEKDKGITNKDQLGAATILVVSPTRSYCEGQSFQDEEDEEDIDDNINTTNGDRNAGGGADDIDKNSIKGNSSSIRLAGGATGTPRVHRRIRSAFTKQKTTPDEDGWMTMQSKRSPNRNTAQDYSSDSTPAPPHLSITINTASPSSSDTLDTDSKKKKKNVGKKKKSSNSRKKRAVRELMDLEMNMAYSSGSDASSAKSAASDSNTPSPKKIIVDKLDNIGEDSSSFFYQAVYYGTDDDFLMKSSVRSYFKANALEDGDAILFSIPSIDGGSNDQVDPSNNSSLQQHPTLPQFLFQFQDADSNEEDLLEIWNRLKENGRWKWYLGIYVVSGIIFVKFVVPTAYSLMTMFALLFILCLVLLLCV